MSIIGFRFAKSILLLDIFLELDDNRNIKDFNVLRCVEIGGADGTQR